MLFYCYSGNIKTKHIIDIATAKIDPQLLL